MTRQIDADALIAILRREAKEWSAFAKSDEMVTENGKSRAAGISLGYAAAARDVEDLVKRQADGNVPTDSSE